jgi:hypothetical protein
MRRPEDDKPEDIGGREAERLKDFLKRKLPPGMPPEELNPEFAGQEKVQKEKIDTGPEEESPPTKDSPEPNVDRSDDS